MSPKYLTLGLLLITASLAYAEWQPLWPGGVSGGPNPPVVEEKVQPRGTREYVPRSSEDS